VAIKPGGSPDPMTDGGEFVLTESSVQLEELIGKYLVGGEGGKGETQAPETGN
jgi:phospholipid/cholesterol/gamma-HCH transport system substrate-binding protein